jgi:hypothetical protein
MASSSKFFDAVLHNMERINEIFLVDRSSRSTTLRLPCSRWILRHTPRHQLKEPRLKSIDAGNDRRAHYAKLRNNPLAWHFQSYTGYGSGSTVFYWFLGRLRNAISRRSGVAQVLWILGDAGSRMSFAQRADAASAVRISTVLRAGDGATMHPELRVRHGPDAQMWVSAHIGDGRNDGGSTAPWVRRPARPGRTSRSQGTKTAP